MSLTNPPPPPPSPKNPLKPQNCKKMLRESPASNALAVTFKNAEFS